MSAEELDKLFRDKLKDRPVAPSNEAWERLQARLQQAAPQQETPNPFMVPVASQEQKEERGAVRMWYYSAAAAVTMLLGVGLWVNRADIDPLQPSATVATVQETKPAAIQNSAPATTVEPYQTAPSATAQEETFAQQEMKQAQPAQAMAAVSGKAAGQQQTSKRNAVTAPVKVQEEKMTPLKEQAVQEQSLLAATTPANVQESAKTASEPSDLKIVVKLDNTQATASLAQASTTVDHSPNQEEHTSGSGRVLKGILKQVKNLKEGEKVNLEELGITKHTFALETRIGNKKITKTIEL
ncbi:hypothetical protein EFA69_16725 [Rufibacter immobilis]|uniref:Uncharacterized protein n=1 Tax=Rufibacter immobilis TaxID=1348778 RepID=A0A3M9MS84_9BACT|nr:hypothetical protein [Rufibacter immobilis]RNI27753.1 hypothetical protein EFA69_16725 [Rufibacter immobilis]